MRAAQARGALLSQTSLRSAILVAALLGCTVVIGACVPQAQVPSTSTGSPVPTVSLIGYLEGQAHIGPLEPVQRVGVPPPSPPPAACTTRGIVIYAAASGVEIQRVPFGVDCGYRAALSPGEYRVEMQANGIDRTTDLPKVVQIQAGATTHLDVTIDTGIR